MAKNGQKKRRKRKKNNRGRSYWKVPNPFEQIPQSEMTEIRAEIAEFYERQFREGLTRLEKLAGTRNVIYLLVNLSISNLFTGVYASGKLSNTWHSPHVPQAGVELFQALVLKNAGNNFAEVSDLTDTLDEIYDLLPKVIEGFSMRRFARASGNSEEKHIFLLQEKLRLHTLGVRNWGYYKQCLDILRSLYSPLAPLFAEAGLMSPSNIISMFEYLVNKSETGFAGHKSKLRRTQRSKSVEAAVLAYHEDFAMPDGAAADFLTYTRKKRYGLKQVKFILSMHSFTLLTQVFTSTYDELTSRFSCDDGSFTRTLEHFCIELGELADHNTEYFFLDNPVWSRPLIPMEEKTIFCPIPQLFTSFAFDTMSSLGDGKLIRAIEDRRAEYLEDKVADLLAKAFPGSNIFKNVKWKDGDQLFETDVLVVIGSYLIIAEAKSGVVSWPALRGAPDRAKKHIKELLIDPSVQSKRLEIKIRAVRDGSGNADFFMEQIDIDLQSIWDVVRLSVTLEDFATIQSNVVLLQPTGWLPADFDSAPTLSVADLETVLSVLPSIPERLFYLISRYYMERNVSYHGDEMDLLGYYIDDGFCQPLGEDGVLELSYMSRSVDAFMIAKDAGAAADPPRRKFTQWWSDMIAHVESRNTPRWTEAAVMLCSLSFRAQKVLEKQAKTLRWQALTGTRDSSVKDDAKILMPDKSRIDAFAIVVNLAASRQERITRMECIADDAFTSSDAKRCLVLALDVPNESYPYQALSILERLDLSI